MRSWKTMPCLSLTRLHHCLGFSLLEDNILLVLSSHLAFAHFVVLVIALFIYFFTLKGYRLRGKNYV